jgi:pimeloyl-ACP methyl ester carboxylesterase
MPSLLVACVVACGITPIPVGASRIGTELGGRAIEVFTYKPASFRDGPLLVVFHGMLRNAQDYRDHARGLSDRSGMLVIAPKFDREHFPDEKYQRGGLLDRDGRATPQDQWTWSYVPKLVEEVRRREGRPDMDYYLIGHSAGAQFAERTAAFVPGHARRVVVANAGVHLFPTRDLPYSFGFGGLPGEFGGDEQLRRYLSQPLTIYLGTADTLRDDSLYVKEEADQQGENRLQRGRSFFEAGERLARRRGWEFGWRLVEAPGIGHDGRAMFDHPKCEQALFGH